MLLSRLCTIALIGSIGSVALADSFKLGVLGEIDRSPYKGIDHDNSVQPYINYESPVFYIDGLEAGVYILHSDTQQLTLGALYDQTGFKPKDSDDWRIKQLNRRKESVMATLDYTLITDFGGFGATLNTDLLGRNKGTTFAVNYSAALTMQDLTVMPVIGLEWHNKRYNNYYYGINHSESMRSGLPEYTSKQGVNPYLELNLSYQVTPKWEIMATGRYDHLHKNIRHSPMVDKSDLYSFQLGIAYEF